MVIPIQIEGGGGGCSPSAKYSHQRKGCEAVLRKPLRKKNSRQKCRTFNIEIELEGLAGKETAERKNGISSKQGQTKGSVSVPSKMITRRTSSKDLRGVLRRQSSRDLRPGLLRRQSSRDLVSKLPHQDTSSQQSRMVAGQSRADVCMPGLDDRFTIRRDSINGLRIVSKLEQSETEALDGLGEIALTEQKKEFTKFQTDALKTHNVYRAKHGARPLTLSQDLCSRAQEYAESLATTDTFQHSGDPDLGENLYWSWSSDPAWSCGGQEPTVSWYEESKGYRYDREPRDTESGHFTQLVWSDSTMLGVGVSRSAKTGRFYVVMKYDPPGNIIGSYTDHVNRPLY